MTDSMKALGSHIKEENKSCWARQIMKGKRDAQQLFSSFMIVGSAGNLFLNRRLVREK